MVDVAVLVPFESEEVTWIDPFVRRASSPAVYRAVAARQRLEEFVGRPLRTAAEMPIVPSLRRTAFRSLSAVTLASSLQRAGMRWVAVDPGLVSFSEWRAHIARLRRDRPRVVALTTTFIQTPAYAAALCSIVRRELPEATLALGGYLYATDTRRFLSLDADVFCIGEGEQRIVDIVERVRDGRPLDDVPGLYLNQGGRLRFTGSAEPPPFETQPLPDWTLAERIRPEIDLDRWMLYHVETQRGCRFKCEFCTFRTVSAQSEQSPSHAVEAIRNAAHHGPGMIWVVDPTATYPRSRWRSILERLVELGGSPLPIRVFARVSDLDDEVCALMAKAGVVQTLIGQESGSQRLLNAMRKGTRVEHVPPAVAAMAKHGITSMFAFIHGFPGENAESLAATRGMMSSLNDGCRDSPCAVSVEIEIFQVQDLATARQREALDGSSHHFDYGRLSMSARVASEEVLASFIALSRIPHAPATGCGVARPALGMLMRAVTTADRGWYFRWTKALDRGLGIFLEQDLDGKVIDLGELRRVREELLSPYSPLTLAERARHRTWNRMRGRLSRHLCTEWQTEESHGVGALTRLQLARTSLAVTGSLGQALRAGARGSCLPFPPGERPVPVVGQEHSLMADDLARRALGAANARPSRRLVPQKT